MNDCNPKENKPGHQPASHDKKEIPAEITLRVIRQFARAYHVYPLNSAVREFVAN